MQLSTALGKPKRRQERGERRMREILAAAGTVFAATGFERATTNAIAAQAGISPGSLYQFFANKQQIAEALAQLYAQELRQVHEEAFAGDPATLPLPDLVEALSGPFLSYHRRTPGFQALFVEAHVSPELPALHDQLCRSVEVRLVEMFARRAPHASRPSLELAAEICVHIFRALLPMATRATSRQQIVESELKAVLVRYLQPILG